MQPLFRAMVAGAALLLAACASVPEGPSVMALPGTGKTFDQFRLDDMDCRQYARNQVGGASANQAASDSTFRTGALGAILGGVAGAAIGGDSGGAAVGAGIGVLGGTAAGSEAGRSSAGEVQGRYDNAYVQCMYAKGQKVPVQGQLMENTGRPAARPPAPPPPPPDVQR